MVKEQTSGPYLTAAFLCEKILQEKDGVVSAIRIVDRIIHSTSAPSAPDVMPPVKVDLKMVIMFKSGSVRGSRNVMVRAVQPSGRAMPSVSVPLLFEGEDRGANIVLNAIFEAVEEGLYWFVVEFENEEITRIPLRLVYQKLSMSTSGATPIN